MCLIISYAEDCSSGFPVQTANIHCCEHRDCKLYQFYHDCGDHEVFMHAHKVTIYVIQGTVACIICICVYSKYYISIIDE